ncbi:MAG: aminopeptidase P family protein [Planctomycetales bacterium]|nr:aminopeptidase P family protein [Planctomycetales bacterium]
MHDRFLSRIDKLRSKIRECECDSMLVSNYTNVTYLTGFTGDSSYLFVTQDNVVLITDFRYITQLEQECPGLDLHQRSTNETMPEMVEVVVKKAGVSKLAIEASTMSVALRDSIAERLPSAELVSSTMVVELLRQIKDDHEIEEIRRSIRMAERAFETIKASLRGDQTEKLVTAELEHQIRLFGGVGCAFPPIVGVGPQAALPHAVPGDSRIADDDFVLIDWGAKAGLYLSDLTRVLVTGSVSDKLRRIYRIVLNAQEAAISKIAPGVPMCDVDAAARSVIADAGHAEHFGHGLGHGFGLEIHEQPRLGAKHSEPLEVGMVITVEPGIYLPGWGGVRIEDDVLVTESGHEVLSRVSKQLDDCIVEL